MILCTHCKNENPVNSNYCSKCGKQLGRQCAQCDATLLAEAKFCIKCGASATVVAQQDTSRRTEKNNSLDSISALEEPQRRQLTILSCDVVDSTLLVHEFDPEDIRSVHTWYQQVCGRIVNKHGGSITSLAGDGIFALFGYPIAHELDALEAVRAAIEIIQEVTTHDYEIRNTSVRLSVRIGVATGLVVAGDVKGEFNDQRSAVFGETPNLASRLQSEAHINGILVSENTNRIVRRYVPCDRVASLSLKGWSSPVSAYRVVSEAIHDTVSVSPAHAQQLPYVARSEEQQFLKNHWSKAKQGTGSVVVLHGEPGIGKTRLVREFHRQLVSETIVYLEFLCAYPMRDSPLYPVITFVDTLFRDQSGGVNADAASVPDSSNLASRFQSLGFEEHLNSLFSAFELNGVAENTSQVSIKRCIAQMVEFLSIVSRQVPVLLVVEDVQWSDPTTMTLLGSLINNVPLSRLMMIATARFDSRFDWPVRSYINHLTLDRLSEQDCWGIVNELLESVGIAKDIQHLVIKRSDGVPLFLEELSRAIIEMHQEVEVDDFSAEEIPLTLRDSLMARLDHLGEAKFVAQTGAVVGRTFSFAILHAVLRQTPEKLEESLRRLSASELVYTQGVGNEAKYFFRHALIRDIAYDSLLITTRKRLHRRVAEALNENAARGGTDPPDLLARHYFEAGLVYDAIQQWCRAGEVYIQKSAHREALSQVRKGLAHLTEIKDASEHDKLALSLYTSLGLGLQGTKGYAVPEVEEAFQKALDLYQRLGETDEHYSLIHGMYSYYSIRGPLEKAISLATQMSAAHFRDNSNTHLIECDRTLGWMYVCRGDFKQGQNLLKKALARYDQAQTKEFTKRSLTDAGSVGMINLAWSEWFTGDVTSSVQHVQKSVDIAHDVQHPFTLAYALSMGAAVYQCLNKPQEVIKLVDESIAIAKKHDFRYWIAWCESLKGWALVQIGETVKGRTSIEAGYALHRETGARIFGPHIMAMLAESSLLLGDGDQAIEELRIGQKIQQDHGAEFYSAEIMRLLGCAYYGEGDTDQAMVYLRKAVELAQKQQAQSIVVRSMTFLLELSPDAKEKRAVGKALAVELRDLRQRVDTGNRDIERAEMILGSSLATEIT